MNNDKKLIKLTNPKPKEKDNIFNIIDVIFISCFLLAIILGFVFSKTINKTINNITNEVVSKITINNGVKAHVLNVGQAECVIVELPDNKLLMYDTGLEENANYIINYVNKNCETRVIDYLILSHTDADHIGGACKILDRYEIKNIVRPIVKSNHENFKEHEDELNKITAINDELYAQVLTKIYNENANVYFADYKNVDELNNVFDGQNYNIQFYLPHFYTSSELNDFSSVITITYMGQTLMITGDATERTEKSLLKNYQVPDVNFIVLAHHGSNTSSSFKFLSIVKPEYVYISVGKNNTYNHPHVETLNKLDYLNIKPERIYLTSNCEDIILAFNGEKIENYYDAIKINIILVLIGLVIVVIFVYIPKIRKIFKLINVKNRRKKIKIIK